MMNILLKEIVVGFISVPISNVHRNVSSSFYLETAFFLSLIKSLEKPPRYHADNWRYHAAHMNSNSILENQERD